ncbi:MAG: hypothetical protein J6V80_04335, partial [Clostridia bacterium]|nr:hypothetical protein [Clostridia bacterium]
LVATADGTSISTLEPTYTPWIAADADNKTIEVAVELPLAYEKQTDSNVKINFHVEAVQANGYTPETKVESVDELTEAFANAKPGEVINAEGVTLDIRNPIDLPASVTIKGLNVVSYGSQNFIKTAAGDGVVTFEDCTFGATDFTCYAHFASGAGCESVVFNNCTMNDGVQVNFADNPNGSATFNNCTFALGSSGAGWVTCMGGNQTFNSCSFSYSGGLTFGSNQYVKKNAVNAYSDGYSVAVTLIGCSFTGCSTQRFTAVSGYTNTLTIK